MENTDNAFLWRDALLEIDFRHFQFHANGMQSS